MGFKRYAQFFVKVNGETMELLGSDGVMLLDARMTIKNNVKDCHSQIAKMARIHSNICGFIIYRASRFSDTSCKIAEIFMY